MDMVEGRIFWDAALPSLAPKERDTCYDAMNAAMARRHRVDVEAVGLADFGRPGNYYERRSAEQTSELQSIMRISYAVFCLKKQTTITHCHNNNSQITTN